jgi:aconitate hydratase
MVIAGDNYAQGSSREHAAMCPRYLGQKAVIAKSYSRIGWQNLINFGILPLEFANKDDYDKIDTGDKLKASNLLNFVAKAEPKAEIEIDGKNTRIEVVLNVSERQRRILLAGGVINYLKNRMQH